MHLAHRVSEQFDMSYCAGSQNDVSVAYLRDDDKVLVVVKKGG